MGRKTILLIEDNTDFREALADALADYEVISASDGTEGLKEFRSRPVDLVLLDIRMEGIDGVEVLRQIRSINLSTPVVIITGYSTQEVAEKVADLGVSGYLKKPFNLSTLEEKVYRLLYFQNKPQQPLGARA